MAGNNILTSTISTSMSTTMGSMTTIIKNFVQGKFPEDYFKSYHVTTEIASSQFDQDDIINNELPELALDPSYDPSEENEFSPLPRWHRVNQFVYNDTDYNYIRVLFNDEDGYYIYAVPDRVRLNFEVRMRFRGQQRGWDIGNFIKRRFDIGGYFYLEETPLESHVPKSFLSVIMEDMGIDPTSDEELNDFYRYLKEFSRGYITRKENLSTGNYTYDYKYRTNVLCQIPDQPSIDHIEDDQATGRSVVTFPMNVEFWAPGSFVLETEEELEGDPDQDTGVLDTGEEIILNYALKTGPEETVGDKNLLFYQGYVTDTNVEEDTIDTTSIWNDQLIEVINYNNENEIDNYSIFEVVVFRDAEKLEKGVDYTFDWDTLELTTVNPFQNYTHHVAIYGNLAEINETLEE